MDVSVRTGKTKASEKSVLVTKSIETPSDEQVVVLLQYVADPVAAKSLQKECLDIVQHALVDTEGEAPQRLDSTLKELNGLFRGLLMSKALTELNAILAIIEKDGMLSVSHAGMAEAYVVRGGMASQITEYTKGKPTPTFVHIASGQVEPSDVIVLSTQRLLRAVTPAQLGQISQSDEDIMSQLVQALTVEKEEAALASVHCKGGSSSLSLRQSPVKKTSRRQSKRNPLESVTTMLSDMANKGAKQAKAVSPADVGNKLRGFWGMFARDLKDPGRKKKAHLLVLAGILVVFLFIWAAAHLTSFSQKSQTKAQLEQVLEEIQGEIRKGENRRLTGDIDSANAILQRAEDMTKEVMNDDSGLFRVEALDLFEQIKAKREEINNITRLAPGIQADLSSKKAAVEAQGFVNIGEQEFIAYDRQDLYRVAYNSVDDPVRLSEEELILDGVNFPRFQTQVYQVTGNGIIEMINGIPVSMKTEDESGWIAGKDMKAYLRYLYVLAPENNQIYKYERFSNRYSSPVAYNVNGELEGALDMAIDGNVYVLKDNGTVVKLLRGETQPFLIRHAPEGVLASATKIFKVFEGNLYFLDPKQSRVIVVTDGGVGGEATYLRQYVLSGDQVGTLTDLYVDSDESRLFVTDEKRIYTISLRPNSQSQ